MAIALQNLLNTLRAKVSISGTDTDSNKPRPSAGAALLSWDNITNDTLIQWDDDAGNAKYIEWDV